LGVDDARSRQRLVLVRLRVSQRLSFGLFVLFQMLILTLSLPRCAILGDRAFVLSVGIGTFTNFVNQATDVLKVVTKTPLRF
jgi:hypothetical protein